MNLAVAVSIHNVQLEMVDDDPLYHAVVPEITNAYRPDDIEWREGDVVLDIGAHVGIVSMYIAKQYPVKVYAYEPEPELFKKLKRHLEINGVADRVSPFCLAVTADGRDLEMRHGVHSAEATGHFPSAPHGHTPFKAKSTTVPEILKQNKIERVRLLKLDCEGAEHEILAESDEWMDRVDYVRGEIHFQHDLADLGYTVEDTMGKVPMGKIAPEQWMVVY